MTVNRRQYERVCARCGEDFLAAKPQARYCSDNCRKRAHADGRRAACVDCGGEMGEGSGYGRGTLRCAQCSRAKVAADAETRVARFEELWAAGRTLQEIADEMGLADKWSAGATVSMYRAAGRNFPYRRSGQALEHLRANRWGREVAA